MKPITIPTKEEFQFEDLFPSSPVEGGWNVKNTPDVAGSRLDAGDIIEEDIGEEQDYDEDEEEEKAEEEKLQGENNNLPAESIKLSSTIGPQSFTTLARVGKGGFGSVCFTISSYFFLFCSFHAYITHFHSFVLYVLIVTFVNRCTKVCLFSLEIF